MPGKCRSRSDHQNISIRPCSWRTFIFYAWPRFYRKTEIALGSFRFTTRHLHLGTQTSTNRHKQISLGCNLRANALWAVSSHNSLCLIYRYTCCTLDKQSFAESDGFAALLSASQVPAIKVARLIYRYGTGITCCRNRLDAPFSAHIARRYLILTTPFCIIHFGQSGTCILDTISPATFAPPGNCSAFTTDGFGAGSKV